MTNYEKMTLESFLKNLKAKKYANATGARRSIGKSQDLSAPDKVKAHAEINKFYGVEPAKAAPKKAAKKVPVKTKAAPKKAAKKIAAKSKVTHAKPAKRHPVVTRQPATSQTQIGEERAMRQHSAATVFSTLHGKAPIEKGLEAKLLHTAALEYLANASVSEGSDDKATSAIKPSERVARPRVSVPKAAPVQVEAAPESANGTAPPFDRSTATPKQIEQWDALQTAHDDAERN
jgi:hypothetical protein